MLIHQPYGDYYGAYRDLERALESEKVRSIGVSNFGVFDFSLADEDRAAIAALDQDRSIVFDHRDPSLMGGFLKGLGAARKQA